VTRIGSFEAVVALKGTAISIVPPIALLVYLLAVSLTVVPV
jgi:hypothetical protein